MTYSLPLTVCSKLRKELFPFGKLKFFFCTVYPYTSESKRMRGKHHITHNKAAVINMSVAAFVRKNYKYHRRAVERIKTFFPAAYFAVCLRYFVSEFLVCYGYCKRCLSASAACGIESRFDYLRNIFFIGKLRFEASDTSTLFHCFYYFIHIKTSLFLHLSQFYFCIISFFTAVCNSESDICRANVKTHQCSFFYNSKEKTLDKLPFE